jgi:glycosyltransferase involved in cell wall biosynthesis
VPRVTVTIITLDEADHIAAAIDSVAWADEVIVVDSGSADDTVAIARAKGARTEVRAWTGYVDQKNFAAGLASHDWVFSLDADERVTAALAREVRAVLTGSRRSRATGSRGSPTTSDAGSGRRTSIPTTRHGCTTGAAHAGRAATCTSR